jgi:dephospho-CoA kinase
MVAQMLKSMGYPVFHSDEEAKIITQQHPEVRAKLTARFGDNLYMGGTLQKAKLAELIFTDTAARAFVNGLIHPLVREAFAKWSAEQNAGLVFNEAAILFETGAWKQFDHTILVTAPEALRIHRVMERDNTREDQVRARLSNQWDDAQKIPLSSYCIANDDRTPVLGQLEAILKELET